MEKSQLQTLKSLNERLSKENVENEKEKKALEMKIECLEKEVAELSESSFYLKQEKEENGKEISELVKRIEEGVKKENDLLMEVDGLVEELVREEKDVEKKLTQQRESLDVNLNRVQQVAVSLRRTIEIITRDKAKMEEAKVEVKNVVVDLRRELSKLKEGMKSLTESSEVENGRNEELLLQMGCLQEAPNGVSSEKDKLSLLLEDKDRKLKKPRLSSRKRKRCR